MRIGTWNMEGRSGASRQELLSSQECDVLLLTEVPLGWSLPGYHVTPAGEPMVSDKKQWAVVASRTPLLPCAAPHPTTTAAVVGGVTFVCSVLPWGGSGGKAPWAGPDHPSRVAATLQALQPFLSTQTELVWGGDWNHAFRGRERAGSAGGRAALVELLQELRLEVPTRELAHRLPGLLSIDHIAVRPAVTQSFRVVAERAGRRLSDHDLYIVDGVERPL